MIKVLIERQIAEDLADHYQRTAKQTLQKAMDSHGFIAGESLKDANDPNHRIVIAAYNDLADWTYWYHSEARKEMMSMLRPLLLEDEKITILEHI